MTDPLRDFSNRLDEALAPARQAAGDRLQARRIVQAAKTGGEEAARKVAAEMGPEQAQRVMRRLKG
ncbi:hypothetical protein [Streptomyces formicae]